MDKGEKVTNMAYNDTKAFLATTRHWAKEECCGSYICYGLLIAVLEVVFSLAPSKEDAMEIVMAAVDNFVKESDA